jgi:hypothetical protein
MTPIAVLPTAAVIAAVGVLVAAPSLAQGPMSSDKTLAFVEGASHMYTPCGPCEKSPGQFGDTVKTTYDYVDRWLSQRGRF